MVLQNYQNLIEMTSNIIDIVAFGVGFKCPRKIHLNTQCPPKTNYETQVNNNGISIMSRSLSYKSTFKSSRLYVKVHT